MSFFDKLSGLNKKIELPPQDAPRPIDETHTHQWELLLKTYSSPKILGQIAQSVSESVLQKALFGFTTLHWQCKVGGETKTEELLGSDTTQLDDLVVKADQVGTQYFQVGSNTYAIGKIQGQTGALPIK